MKTIITVFISGVGILFGSSSYQQEENRRIEAEQVALWESKLAEAQSSPPDTRSAALWLGLRNMGYRKNYDGHSPAVDAIFLKLQQELLSIPGHASDIANKIKREQEAVKDIPRLKGPRNDYDRNRGFLLGGVLAHLPSPETVQVLGDFLADDKDFLDQIRGFEVLANSSYAMGALRKIGLRNPPQTGSITDNPADIAIWRDWYEEIKSGKRTFSFHGQKTEYRFKPDGTWETITFNNPPNDTPTPPPLAKVIAQSVVKPSMPVNDSEEKQWAWIIGVLAALLIGGFWLKQRGVK